MGEFQLHARRHLRYRLVDGALRDCDCYWTMEGTQNPE